MLSLSIYVLLSSGGQKANSGNRLTSDAISVPNKKMFSLFPSIIFPVHALIQYSSSCFPHLLHNFPFPFTRIFFFCHMSLYFLQTFPFTSTYLPFFSYVFSTSPLNLIFIRMPTFFPHVFLICFATFHFLVHVNSYFFFKFLSLHRAS